MKFLQKIFNIKVLAVIFGIVLWYYVSITQGPVITKTFKNVPVVPINIPQESYVINDIDTISVVAEGPSKIILGLRDTDFIATVDLSDKKEGDFSLQVEVRAPSNTIKIKSYTPEKVRVIVETITSKKFPIVSEFVNNPLNSQFYPSVPIISPQEVTVSGPTSEIEKIKRVYVSIDLSKITTNTTLTLPVSVETIDGSTLKNVYLNPSNVLVTVNMSQDIALVTVPIVPVISNTPPSGFAIRSISINPSVITISGPIGVISSIKSIETQPIDVSSLVKKTDLTVKLSKIDKVNFPFDSCTVTINIEPLTTKTLSIPVDVIVMQGHLYSLSQNYVNVMISGFKDVVDNITTDSFKAQIDASTLDVGTYTLPVNLVNAPKNVIIRSITPSSLEVKIY